ncbi:hypothetical protein COS16_04975, partial [Candidatus Desantisbacteria bacterium CG02_land_8_20_14_3_00_49_13]
KIEIATLPLVARNDNSKQNQMSRDLCDTTLDSFNFKKFLENSFQDSYLFFNRFQSNFFILID